MRGERVRRAMERAGIPTWAERALLAAALVAVAFAAFLPHWNPVNGERNPYPVHLDEYLHWGFAKAIREDATLSFRNPFSDTGPVAEAPQLGERGFHAYLAVFQGMTGVPWETLFVYAPAALALLLALAAYALARRWGAGLYAVLLVAAIPTTLRFLGPGYLVPIAFSLPLVAIGILALVAAGEGARPWAFALMAAAVWPVHAMAGLVLASVALLYAAAHAAASPTRALLVAACVLLPLLVASPIYATYVDHGVETPTLPASLDALRAYGWIAYALAAIGAARLALSARPQDRALGLALGVPLLGLLGVLVARAVWGIDPFRLYDRSVLMSFLLAALLGAVGLATLVALAARGAHRVLRGARPAPVAAALLGLALLALGANLAGSVRAQSDDIDYVVLTPALHERYERAGALTADVPGRALVDGIATMAFTDITGRATLFVLDPSGGGPPAFVKAFFAGGANDTALLVETRTTVVITDQPVVNEDLVPLGDGVYVLRPDYVARLPP